MTCAFPLPCAMATSTFTNNRFRKILGFQPYSQFQDTGTMEVDRNGQADSNELELANVPGWQGVPEADSNSRYSRSPDYYV